MRNLRKGGENFEIWKYGCTNENEPDWDGYKYTTTITWPSTTTTTPGVDPSPTSKPVIIEPGFQINTS